MPASEFRGKIYDSILDTVGATPLVRVKRLADDAGVKAQIVGKLEFFNPLASVKDRIGFAMIESAERAGTIQPVKQSAANVEKFKNEATEMSCTVSPHLNRLEEVEERGE